MHEQTAFMVAQPKVVNPLNGWFPGDPTMEPKIYYWSKTDPTEWNQLLRATSDIDSRGFGVFTIVVSTDIVYYSGKYI